jgi:hypothetical protein
MCSLAEWRKSSWNAFSGESQLGPLCSFIVEEVASNNLESYSLQAGDSLIFHPKARTVFRLTLASVIEPFNDF